jgi:hypothetical protein
MSCQKVTKKEMLNRKNKDKDILWTFVFRNEATIYGSGKIVYTLQTDVDRRSDVGIITVCSSI